MPRTRSVTVIHEVVHDRTERLSFSRGQLVMTDLGDLPVLRFLDQVYDRHNVVALDITLDKLHLTGIRRIDRGLEKRLCRTWRAALERNSDAMSIRFRVVAVLR